jgi:N-acetylgalactosamine-N,N'-diacetylbacillosaminyl-diphospho-undecaprenol 4-alpha-N-acetylgalactosaminyltransferase
MSKKICLLVDCLSSGGAEKVASHMSFSLTAKGYNVTIVSMRNELGYLYKGTLFNLGLIKEKHSRLSSLLLFEKFFKEQKFDVIIDHRVRNKFFKELLFSKFVFNKSQVIYCVHHYDLNFYFSYLKWPMLARLPHVKKKQFVAVCDEIKSEMSELLDLESVRVYNYILADKILKKASQIHEHRESEYIISIGRLVKLKQFDILITCYAKSKLPKNNIKLLILGNGSEKEKLELLISHLNLNDYVELIPFQNNPYMLIKKAKSLILPSRAEGFPMVLIEALTLMVPIIAFNCKSGPNEIVKNMVNGLLVEDQNQEQMTSALNRLLLDTSFYNKIKENTSRGLEKFSETKIIEKWANLLESQT